MEQGDAANVGTKRDQDPENLRAEYSALSAYFNTVVTFRFTTLGFYWQRWPLSAAARHLRDQRPSSSS
jgi:hypothetical protein